MGTLLESLESGDCDQVLRGGDGRCTPRKDLAFHVQEPLEQENTKDESPCLTSEPMKKKTCFSLCELAAPHQLYTKA